ncbi:hypothetical protein Esti_005168 [Eimeria stiedai]
MINDLNKTLKQYKHKSLVPPFSSLLGGPLREPHMGAPGPLLSNMEGPAACSSSSSSSAAREGAAAPSPEEANAAALAENIKAPLRPKNRLEGNHLRWSAAASGAAAVLTCCMLHPLDLIKTRMQVAAITQGAVPRYPSTTSAIRWIFQQQGIKGLWQGVGVTAAASAVSVSVSDFFRCSFDSLSLRCPRWRATIVGCEETRRSWLDDAASGLVSGVVVTGLTHPLWLAKARMEMQSKETQVAGWPRFRNGFDCILYSARGGWRESYKGIGPALALAPHVAIQITVYEHIREGAHTSSPLAGGLPAVWGAVSKFAALSCTMHLCYDLFFCGAFRMQVLRSRQQVHKSPYQGLNFLRLGGRISTSAAAAAALQPCVQRMGKAFEDAALQRQQEQHVSPATQHLLLPLFDQRHHSFEGPHTTQAPPAPAAAAAAALVGIVVVFDSNS